jgi:ADP-heptose:LPS heptosyltransferase
MALVESAQLVIAPDSFLVHCAAAFDVPCIALWNDATETTPEPITEEIDIAIRTRAANPYFTHSAVPGERPSDRIPPPESRVSTYDNVSVLNMTTPIQEIIDHAASVLGLP